MYDWWNIKLPFEPVKLADICRYHTNTRAAMNLVKMHFENNARMRNKDKIDEQVSYF